MAEKIVATFQVEDFGAVGDGVTNDGPAISLAVQAALSDPSDEKIIKFRPEAIYRVTSVPPFNRANRLFSIYGGDNIHIVGDNTTLLMQAPIRVLYVENSRNVTLSGFTVDYAPKPFVLGTVINFSSEGKYIDFVTDEELGFSGQTFSAPHPFFAFPNRSDIRLHFFIAAYERLDEASKFRMHLTDASVGRLSQVNIDQSFLLPYVGASHHVGSAFNIVGSENIGLSNITIYSLPDFGFDIRGNTGPVRFTDIRLTPDPKHGANLVAWRDGFHVKDNTAPIIWDRVHIGPLGDDALNISAVNFDVNQVLDYKDDMQIVNASPAEAVQIHRELAVGDDFIAFDLGTGAYIGEGTVREVLPRTADRFNFAIGKLPDLKPGMQIGFYKFANPGFIVQNSYVEGTVRVRGSGTFVDTVFNVFWLAIENESYIEGPIPRDIRFQNVTFTTPYDGDPNIVIIGTQRADKTRNAEYKVRKVIFDSVTFEKGNMFVEPGNEVEM